MTFGLMLLAGSQYRLKNELRMISKPIADANKLRLLAENSMLCELSPDQLEALAGRSRVETHEAHRTLFSKGDPGIGLMGVITGRVQISSQSAEGKEIVLNIIGAGGVFGELALLDGAPRTADATTIEPTELLVLDRRDFLPFLQRNPEVGLALLRVVAGRLRQTSQQLEDIIFLRLPSLLAKRLLWLAETCGHEVAEGCLIDMRLSQQQLANLVGVTRESVNKQLQEWRDAEIIAMRNRQILILNEDALRRLSESWEG